MGIEAAGTFTIGGGRPVRRLGFGAMRITGPGIWGHPADVGGAKRLLHRVVELGTELIDTADSYGPEVSEYLLAEALHPYPSDLLIATKGGLVRGGPDDWGRDGRPDHLRRACHNSLRRLRVEQIGLYQLHAPDPNVPFEDSVGALKRLRDEGKIVHVGLSNVSVDQLERARRIVPIVSVQNRYNLTDRSHEAVLQHCAREGIGFIPWYPLAVGKLADEGGPIAGIARKHGARPGQVALAWLLQKADVVLPIPGTSSIAHLEENVAGADVKLDADDLAALDRIK